MSTNCKKKERIQINKIRNEKGNVTTDTTKIRTVGNYYKQLCANRLENLEVDRFLDTNNLPKYTNNQDGDLISNRALPTKKTSVPDGFTAELSQTFKEELTPIFLKLLKTIESKDILPNCFYKASLT